MCGDIAQIDLRKKHDSGMVFLSGLDTLSEIGKIELRENHRHLVVDQILSEYRNYIYSEKENSKFIYVSGSQRRKVV